MSTHTLETHTAMKVLPLAGTAYVVASLVGNSLTESVPNLADKAGSPAFAAGVALEVTGFAAILVFAAWASTRLDGIWGTLALASGITMLAVKLSSGAPFLATVHDGLDPELAESLQAMNDWSFILHWLPFGLMVIAVARGAKQAGLLRTPGSIIGTVLGTITAVQTLIVVANPAALIPIPFLLCLIWLAVTGVVAARRS